MSRGIIGVRIPPMFEVGETYRLEWTEGKDHHYQSGEVLAWAAPLLKVKLQSGEKIINTSSSTFVSAAPAKPYSLDEL